MLQVGKYQKYLIGLWLCISVNLFSSLWLTILWRISDSLQRSQMVWYISGFPQILNYEAVNILQFWMLDNERNGIIIWPECILCASFMSPCLQLEPLQMIIWCTAFIYTHYKKNRHYTLLGSNYKQVPFVHVHGKWHKPVIGVYSGMQVYG